MLKVRPGGKPFHAALVIAATVGVLFSVSSAPAGATSAADPVILSSSIVQADETDAIVTVDFTSDQSSHWFVEWGTTTSYGTQGATGVAAAGETHTGTILGPALQGGTVYHYRVVVQLFDGVSYSRTFQGPDNIVTTKPAPSTGAAPAIVSVIAFGASLTCDCFQIRASVDTRGASTALSLEYGITSALGSTAPLTTLSGPGLVFVDDVQGPTGLSTGTTYFWRLVATNAAGSTASDVQTIDVPVRPTNAPPPHNQSDCTPEQTTWLKWTSEPLRVTEGTPFSQSLGSGGTPRYTVMAMDDFTPEWLTVDDETLALSGTPPAAGEYTFQWCIVDSTGQASGIVVHIDVAAPAATPPAAPPKPPTSAAAPRLLSPATIAGTASVGHVLHVRAARWEANPTRISFQWQVRSTTGAWRPIAGATKPMLRLRPSLAARRVRAIERAWFAHGARTILTSRSLLIAR